MLGGKTVNLRLIERNELPTVLEWDNDPNFMGEFEPISQKTLTALQKQYDELKDTQWFFIEKKDKKIIGYIVHIPLEKHRVIGYALIPEERGKGYGSEAIKIMVDYLFLSKDIVRIQAETHPNNVASQEVLQKAGFSKEGIIRKSFFSRGVWRDTVLYSIIRDEWREPKILTKTS